MEEQVKETLPEVPGVPCIGVSALTGAGAQQVLPTALQAFRVWNQRVPTARLNRWLIKARSPTAPCPVKQCTPRQPSCQHDSGPGSCWW